LSGSGLAYIIGVTSNFIFALYSDDWLTFVAVFASLAAAYIIFGIAGFGAALISAPVLAHRIPVANVVPLLALLDFIAALTTGIKLNNKIDFRELAWLVPLMAIGTVFGIVLLMSLPSAWAAAALGAFAISYGLFGLFSKETQAPIARSWIVPIGLAGGVVSGLFGSGGFIYALYLGRRLADNDAMRATQSTLIALATATRAIIFFATGAYNDMRMIAMVLAGLPALFIGLYIGHRISVRLSREQFFRLLCVISIVTGSSLVLRFVL
jgi:uncharacterized membrane protein YfcA